MPRVTILGDSTIKRSERKEPAPIIKDKEKLRHRIKTIKGRINGHCESARYEECSKVFETIAACSGAVNGLMAEVPDRCRLPAKTNAAAR